MKIAFIVLVGWFYILACMDDAVGGRPPHHSRPAGQGNQLAENIVNDRKEGHISTEIKKAVGGGGGRGGGGRGGGGGGGGKGGKGGLLPGVRGGATHRGGGHSSAVFLTQPQGINFFLPLLLAFMYIAKHISGLSTAAGGINQPSMPSANPSSIVFDPLLSLLCKKNSGSDSEITWNDLADALKASNLLENGMEEMEKKLKDAACVQANGNGYREMFRVVSELLKSGKNPELQKMVTVINKAVNENDGEISFQDLQSINRQLDMFLHISNEGIIQLLQSAKEGNGISVMEVLNMAQEATGEGN